MSRYLLQTITAGLMLAPTLCAVAAPWYEVEVYLFERQATSTEHWPNIPPELDVSNALDLITPQVATIVNSSCAEQAVTEADTTATVDSIQPCIEQGPQTIYPSTLPTTINPKDSGSAVINNAVLLNDSRSKFKQKIQAISRQAGVKPLLHMTWQQAMRSRSSAQPVHLFSGKNFNEEFQYSGMPIVSGTASTYDVTNSGSDFMNDVMPNHNMPAPLWKFDGLLNIYLSHYLYIETQFLLREKTTKTVPLKDEHGVTTTTNEVEQTPFLQAILMKQKRRVRSQEIHYFDNPRMGMILQIRKMAQPAN